MTGNTQVKQEIVFADLYVHLHADRLMQAAARVEARLKQTGGVLGVHFGDECRHSLYVAYDPQTISAENLMALIRLDCASARRVACIFTRQPVRDDALPPSAPA